MRPILWMVCGGGLLLLQPLVGATTARAAEAESRAEARHGRVEWIREARHSGANPAVGAAAGAVIGGVLGSLFTGHSAGVAAGAAIGAAAGASAAAHHGPLRAYDVGVRFDHGGTQVFTYDGYPPFRPGQEVTLTPRGLVPEGVFVAANPPAGPVPPPPGPSGEPLVRPSTPEPGAPPPPPAPEANAPPPTVPPGQWVDTAQYGWVWMPYGQEYTFTPDYEAGDPYMYVYAPRLGWSWVDAPWLWGWGPLPWFGGGGSVNFAWYGHGWGRDWSGGHRSAHYRRRYEARPHPDDHHRRYGDEHRRYGDEHRRYGDEHRRHGDEHRRHGDDDRSPR
jgi:outer membrane lipoprotein SlyB